MMRDLRLYFKCGHLASPEPEKVGFKLFDKIACRTCRIPSDNSKETLLVRAWQSQEEEA